MRVRISDKQVLQSITPAQLMAYLRSKGATQLDEYPGKATIWQYGNEELLVPVNTYFADYASRIADYVSTVELVESRSQMSIVDDLKNIEFDTIVIKLYNINKNSDNLNVSEFIKFSKLSYNMLLAAASSAATQKIDYPTSKPAEANRFMRNIHIESRMGEYFTLRLLSPIYVKNNNAKYAQSVFPVLQKGIEYIQGKQLSLNDFIEILPTGVTKNLCKSIVEMYESFNTNNIYFSIKYSPMRKTNIPFFETKIDIDSINIIKTNLKIIKEINIAHYLGIVDIPTIKRYENNSLHETVCIKGFVIGLEDDINDSSGQIKIKNILDTPHRFVDIKLTGSDYQRAIIAHKDKLLVEISGTVVKAGRGQRLLATSPLSIIVEDNV